MAFVCLKMHSGQLLICLQNVMYPLSTGDSSELHSESFSLHRAAYTEPDLRNTKIHIL